MKTMKFVNFLKNLFGSNPKTESQESVDATEPKLEPIVETTEPDAINVPEIKLEVIEVKVESEPKAKKSKVAKTETAKEIKSKVKKSTTSPDEKPKVKKVTEKKRPKKS